MTNPTITRHDGVVVRVDGKASMLTVSVGERQIEVSQLAFDSGGPARAPRAGDAVHVLFSNGRDKPFSVEVKR